MERDYYGQLKLQGTTKIYFPMDGTLVGSNYNCENSESAFLSNVIDE